MYALWGVKHAWIVDPLSQTLEVYRIENERWSLIQGFSADEGDKLIHPEPFEAVPLDLDALWTLGVP